MSEIFYRDQVFDFAKFWNFLSQLFLCDFYFLDYLQTAFKEGGCNYFSNIFGFFLFLFASKQFPNRLDILSIENIRSSR